VETATAGDAKSQNAIGALYAKCFTDNFLV